MNDSNIIFVCEQKVALNSPDHIFPTGTRTDNSTNKFFNRKAYLLYQAQNKQLAILDIGCSGGGFVKECIENGHFAIGLEGSDYSKKHRRAAWATNPESLYTCDITRNFDIYIKNGRKRERKLFNIVTAWEVMEHIADIDLLNVAENVKKHLAKDGLWIMSISPNKAIVNGFHLHQTVHGKKWWIKRFEEKGLINRKEYERYFNTQYIRSQKYGAPNSFHLFLTIPGNSVPKIPSENIFRRIQDRWIGSFPQKLIKRIVVGE